MLYEDIDDYFYSHPGMIKYFKRKQFDYILASAKECIEDSCMDEQDYEMLKDYIEKIKNG